MLVLYLGSSRNEGCNISTLSLSMAILIPHLSISAGTECHLIQTLFFPRKSKYVILTARNSLRSFLSNVIWDKCLKQLKFYNVTNRSADLSNCGRFKASIGAITDLAYQFGESLTEISETDISKSGKIKPTLCRIGIQ